MTDLEVDFNNLLERAIAICKEVTPKSDGVPYFLHSQEAFPFFIARTEPVQFEGDSEELDIYKFNLRVRHITGHRTAGYKGEAERKLNQQSPPVLRAFRGRTLLQSDLFPEPPDWLEEARLTEGGGVSVFDASALGGDAMQIGCDYVLEIKIRMENEQEYY